jgi:hypothetical protein
MSGGGWIKLHRGWRDCTAFADEPFTERDAWVWLVEFAAWKPTTRRDGQGSYVTLARGQIHVSDRSLASVWRWNKKKVRQFLARLKVHQMVDHQRDHAGTVLTVLNYETYQSAETEAGPSSGPSKGPSGDHAGTTHKESKEGKDGKEAADAGSGYAFEGVVIRLNESDLDRWRSTFHAIPDLLAELTSLDAWLCGNGKAKQANWFHTVAGALNRKHQDLLAGRAKVAADPDYMPL